MVKAVCVIKGDAGVEGVIKFEQVHIHSIPAIFRQLSAS